MHHITLNVNVLMHCFARIIINLRDRMHYFDIPGSMYHALFLLAVASFGLIAISNNAIRNFLIRYARDPLVDYDELVDSVRFHDLLLGQDVARSEPGWQV
jgi:hypothetical protein